MPSRQAYQEAIPVNKKLLRRIGAVSLSAVLGAGALMMCAGCTSTHPEVRITYVFNSVEYEVDYVLSRNDAPRTVQHFIELAETGYYEGMCIHDYTSSILLGGGYRLVEEEDGSVFTYAKGQTLENSSLELTEVDYFSEIRELEKKKNYTFTQSVWEAEGTDSKPVKGNGLYTVYGEFPDNQVTTEYSRDNRHVRGALVMYFTDKSSREDVTVERADGGKNNDGEPLQNTNYVNNSATSLFYTWLSSSTTNETYNGDKYCVFGMAKNYNDQLRDGLLQAITDYIDKQTEINEDYSFTVSNEMALNKYEFFDDVKKGDKKATFETPTLMPIIIRSVKVTKY